MEDFCVLKDNHRQGNRFPKGAIQLLVRMDKRAEIQRRFKGVTCPKSTLESLQSSMPPQFPRKTDYFKSVSPSRRELVTTGLLPSPIQNF